MQGVKEGVAYSLLSPSNRMLLLPLKVFPLRAEKEACKSGLTKHGAQKGAETMNNCFLEGLGFGV